MGQYYIFNSVVNKFIFFKMGILLGFKFEMPIKKLVNDTWLVVLVLDFKGAFLKKIFFLFLKVFLFLYNCSISQTERQTNCILKSLQKVAADQRVI